MSERRTLIWWSTGAASFVAAQLTLRDNPDALIVRCETGNEDPDNYRFEADAMKRINATGDFSDEIASAFKASLDNFIATQTW